ncbi:hypothetical protein HUJ04_012865 [Dendroctonus ponderosae]|nr:hypothetical protein HUJ04_012865 [Dendroctonus ponderosae]
MINKKTVKIAYSSEEDLFNKLTRLRKETTGEHVIATHQTRGIKSGTLRKMLEGIFHNATSKVVIYTRPNGPSQPTPSQATHRQRNSPNTFAIVVSNKGKTYEETLRGVKEILTTNKLGEGVKALRSTKDGRLVITTERQVAIVEKLSSTLQRNNDGAENIKVVGKQKAREPIHIRGLESQGSKEDAVAALRRKFDQIKEDDYSLSDLRPNINNTQAVTLMIDRGMAKELLCEKRIKIGLVMCSMETRINLQRCSRCWNYGHQRQKCTGTDRFKLCFACGEAGQKTRECTKEPSCPICQKKGHRAGSG